LRNKIRLFLNSFQNKNDIVQRIVSSVTTFQAAEKIIQKELNSVERDLYVYDKKYAYYTISFSKFFGLDEELQIRILFKMLRKIGNNSKNIRFSKVEQLIVALHNFKKYTLNGCVFEKVNSDFFVCYREYNSIPDKYAYLKKGELKQYLKFLKQNNYNKYKQLKDFKGRMKEILYTIPVEDYRG